MVFFARSDWLLKLTIVSVIRLPGTVLGFASVFFPHLSEKQDLFDAGYPLVWYILKQLFTSVSVKSSKYLPRRFGARQISTTIDLDFGE